MRRRVLIAGTTGAVACTGAGWWVAAHPKAAPAATAVPTATATIRRTDLSASVQVSGALGFTGDYTVYVQGQGGTLTDLPQPGQVIQRGGQLYAVDNRPIRLFYGDRPAWRTLAAGITAGPDVLYLEQNLVALGHATSANLTVDSTFDSATATAVRRWQRATGQTLTGRVDLGTVAFFPGPLRVTSVTANTGSGNHGDGPLFAATSTTATVTIAIPVSQTYLVHPGDAVTVTLPDNKTVPGHVASVSSVATVPESGDNGSGRSPAPTTAGAVTLDQPATAGNLDQAPVQVAITSQTVRGVLAVPITALVALAGGGYGVYLVDSAGRRLVGVTTGLFSTNLVQVTGADLREGATVEVPAS